MRSNSSGQKVERTIYPPPPKSPARKWKNVTEEDIKSFIGLVLSMGLVRLPTYTMYLCNCWLLNLGMKSVINRDLLPLIMRFLHCTNNEVAAPRNDSNYSCIFMIEGLIDLLFKVGNSIIIHEGIKLGNSIIIHEGIKLEMTQSFLLIG